MNIPSPSPLYPSVLQLPLCLRVRHSVSIAPVPVDKTLVFPSSSSSESFALPPRGGSRKDCTCPPERPTARMGSVGWRACAKSSEERGRVQRFSNIMGIVRAQLSRGCAGWEWWTGAGRKCRGRQAAEFWATKGGVVSWRDSLGELHSPSATTSLILTRARTSVELTEYSNKSHQSIPTRIWSRSGIIAKSGSICTVLVAQ